MLRYNILSFAISDDYNIIAIANYKRKENKFYTTLFLQRNDISSWYQIMVLPSQKIEHPRNIKRELTAIVSEMNKNNEFAKYIDQFEYEQKCFDKGNDYFERNKG